MVEPFVSRVRIAPVGIAIALVVSVGCGPKIQRIADVLAAPDALGSQAVRVSGRVTRVLEVPYVQPFLYYLWDGSGELPVTTRRRLPEVGDRVRTRGVILPEAAVGVMHVGVNLLEEKRN